MTIIIKFQVFQELSRRTKERDRPVIGFEVNQKMARRKYWTFCTGRLIFIPPDIYKTYLVKHCPPNICQIGLRRLFIR